MRDGEVVAVEIDLYSNAGCSLDLSGAVMERALFHSDNVYRVAHMRVRGHVCRTNLPSNTAFRGFGGPQVWINFNSLPFSAVWCLSLHVCRTLLNSTHAFAHASLPPLTQGLMFAETWISDVARVCALPEAVVRERNLYVEGDATHFNQRLDACQVSACICCFAWLEHLTHTLAPAPVRRLAVSGLSSSSAARMTTVCARWRRSMQQIGGASAAWQ